jgi:hypothetical protein
MIALKPVATKHEIHHLNQPLLQVAEGHNIGADDRITAAT